MALKRVSIPSPNYSSRGGARVTTIVLHTAEGATTYQSLGSFFQNPGSGVSSHVGIDDTPGTVGEYVPRSGKAWTAANANPWAVQAELCAFAAWSAADWAAHPQMLANTAAWIAEEAAAFGIPLTLLSDAQAQDPNVMGVCQHADLGSMGGGHWDCGPAFPIQQVLQMAAGGAGGGTEDDLPLNDADKQWITKAINDALRQQFAPSGECYTRVRGADNDAIQQNEGNFVRWAQQGATQAK
jgi:hypothetical protein